MNITEIVGVFEDNDKHINYLLYYDKNELKTINRDEIHNHKSLVLNLKIKEKGIDVNNPIGIGRANNDDYYIIYNTKNNKHFNIHSLQIPNIHLSSYVQDKLNNANSQWEYGVFNKYFNSNI